MYTGCSRVEGDNAGSDAAGLRPQFPCERLELGFAHSALTLPEEAGTLQGQRSHPLHQRLTVAGVVNSPLPLLREVQGLSLEVRAGGSEPWVSCKAQDRQD